MKITVFGYYEDLEDEIFSFGLMFIPRKGEFIWVESINKSFEILDVAHNVKDKLTHIKAMSHTVTLTVKDSEPDDL